MKPTLYRMTIPLLFLTLLLFLPIQADARSNRFAPNRTAADLIEAVNQLRAANGLEAYTPNTILSSIAQTHAAYIASTGVLTNFDERGRRPFQRALDAGYPLAGNLSTGGLLTQVIYSGAGVTEEQVITFWQNNVADSVALLSPDYTEVGVGIAAANGLTYYVLVAAASGEATTAVPTVAGTGTAQITGIPNTPLPNGEIFHDVQKDEALWSIAILYDTTIVELKRLNGLASDEIFQGQRLIIKRASTETPTPTDVPVTATLGLTTSTPTLPVTPTITQTPTPLPTPPTSLESGGRVVGGIVLAALITAGLVATLTKRKEKSTE